MSPKEALSAAVDLHRGGRLLEAESIYRQLIAASPDNAEYHHLLGVAQHQGGRHEEPSWFPQHSCVLLWSGSDSEKRI